ncbi:MAG: hypothetical protein QW803_13295 [Candidatus Methanomethylicia archaeon]
MQRGLQRIHFVTPPARGKPIERIFGCNYAFFLQHNVFILYMATLLKSKGFDVKVIDAPIDGFKKVEDIADDSDVYVFYSNFLSRGTDLEAAETIVKIEGRKTIIFTGSDPTWDPEAYIRNDNYYVIRGEPELVLPELLKGIGGGDIKSVYGVSFMNNGKVIHNPTANVIDNLDYLPYPERKLYKNPYKYINPKFKRIPCTTILTSRGCPYRCLYCVPNSFMS